MVEIIMIVCKIEIIFITVSSIIRTVDYPNSFEWSLRSPDNRGCTVCEKRNILELRHIAYV